MVQQNTRPECAVGFPSTGTFNSFKFSISLCKIQGDHSNQELMCMYTNCKGVSLLSLFLSLDWIIVSEKIACEFQWAESNCCVLEHIRLSTESMCHLSGPRPAEEESGTAGVLHALEWKRVEPQEGLLGGGCEWDAFFLPSIRWVEKNEDVSCRLKHDRLNQTTIAVLPRAAR